MNSPTNKELVPDKTAIRDAMQKSIKKKTVPVVTPMTDSEILYYIELQCISISAPNQNTDSWRATYDEDFAADGNNLSDAIVNLRRKLMKAGLSE